MPTKTPATGALFSPHDYRDGLASALVAQPASIVLPATYEADLRDVMMQAQTPSCVAHSVVYAYRLYWFRTHGEWVDFSPRFLDTLVKRFDGQDRATGGTYPRMLFKLLVQYGCATTKTLPNDTSLPVIVYRSDALLTDAVFEEAAKYKSPGYVAVPMDFNTTRANILQYGAVSTLFTIGDELWTPDWEAKNIAPMRTPDVPVSGHQMTQFGWIDPTYNKVRNQWSKDWAENGDNHFSPVVWKPYIREQWAVAQIPADVATFLKQLPAAADFHYNWAKSMEQGQFSDDIKFAQIAFMILGYLPILPPDELGWFGPKMAHANYLFQIANGISPSSQNIGPLTRKALNTRFAV